MPGGTPPRPAPPARSGVPVIGPANSRPGMDSGGVRP
ncbi:hypothetical protein GA0115257_125428 [Streptomyces sp. LcepLS]|nr:hypothetical protein GA0115257_125428 [Streptomyces sp. LcepLS]